jgi:hypothetical protein
MGEKTNGDFREIPPKGLGRFREVMFHMKAGQRKHGQNNDFLRAAPRGGNQRLRKGRFRKLQEANANLGMGKASPKSVNETLRLFDGRGST